MLRICGGVGSWELLSGRPIYGAYFIPHLEVRKSNIFFSGKKGKQNIEQSFALSIFGIFTQVR